VVFLGDHSKRLHYVPAVYGSAALMDLDRFFSFLIYYTVGRTPWAVDQPVTRPLPTHRINAHSRIRTHDPSVRASEDSSCLRPRGHCDRHQIIYRHIIHILQYIIILSPSVSLHL
jgi:hypothetical protein